MEQKYIVCGDDDSNPQRFSDYKSAKAYAEAVAKEDLGTSVEVYQLTATFTASVTVAETEVA